MDPAHEANPRLAFHASPMTTLPVIIHLVEAGVLIATPRLGVRDRSHPKGYFPGQLVTLQVCQGDHEVVLSRQVRIVSLLSKPLSELTGCELRRTRLYSAGWTAVQHDLSFFERRPIAENEMITIVEFSYVTT